MISFSRVENILIFGYLEWVDIQVRFVMMRKVPKLAINLFGNTFVTVKYKVTIIRMWWKFLISESWAVNSIIMMDPFKTGATFNRFLVCSPCYILMYSNIISITLMMSYMTSYILHHWRMRTSATHGTCWVTMMVSRPHMSGLCCVNYHFIS